MNFRRKFDVMKSNRVPDINSISENIPFSNMLASKRLEIVLFFIILLF